MFLNKKETDFLTQNNKQHKIHQNLFNKNDKNT